MLGTENCIEHLWNSVKNTIATETKLVWTVNLSGAVATDGRDRLNIQFFTPVRNSTTKSKRHCCCCY